MTLSCSVAGKFRFRAQLRVGERGYSTGSLWRGLALFGALACLAGFAMQDTAAAPIDLGQVEAEEEPPLPKEEVEEAAKLLQQGKVDDALELLKAVAAEHPTLPNAYVMMSRLFVERLKQANFAVGALERAVVEVPDDPESYIELGAMLARAGHFTGAELLFEKGLGLIDGSAKGETRKSRLRATALSGLAAVSRRRLQWETSEQQLREWIAIDPDSVPAYTRLAEALFNQERYDEAYETLKTGATKDQNQRTKPEVIMGRLYGQTEDQATAEEWMAKAIEAAPDDVDTRIEVANWHLQKGNFQTAMAEAEAAAALDTELLEAKLVMGMAARLLGEHEAAEQHFEAAHLQSPSNTVATNQLALVLIESEDRKRQTRARELAEMNYRQFQQQEATISTLGWVYYRLGRLREAEQLFNRLLQELQKGNDLPPDTKYFISKLQVDVGRGQLATVLLDQALASNQTFAYRSEAEAFRAQLGGGE